MHFVAFERVRDIEEQFKTLGMVSHSSERDSDEPCKLWVPENILAGCETPETV